MTEEIKRAHKTGYLTVAETDRYSTGAKPTIEYLGKAQDIAYTENSNNKTKLKEK